MPAVDYTEYLVQCEQSWQYFSNALSNSHKYADPPAIKSSSSSHQNQVFARCMYSSP